MYYTTMYCWLCPVFWVHGLWPYIVLWLPCRYAYLHSPGPILSGLLSRTDRLRTNSSRDLWQGRWQMTTSIGKQQIWLRPRLPVMLSDFLRRERAYRFFFFVFFFFLVFHDGRERTCSCSSNGCKESREMSVSPKNKKVCSLLIYTHYYN